MTERLPAEATEAVPAVPAVPAATPDRDDDGVKVMEVEGGKGRLSFSMLRELWIFREVLGAFTARQVKVRYKQAVVGIGWAVLQPLLSALMFAVFLGSVAKVPSEDLPYLLFALAGMVCWTFFSTGAGQAMDSIVVDQGLLRKVYFPREILPLAAVGAALVDLVPGLAILTVAAALYGIFPSFHWIALPIPLLLLTMSAASLGLAFSAVNAYYRDVRYALPFLLQVGLFASPVVYPLGKIPAKWRTVYAILNPVAAAIDGLRRIMLHHQWPRWGTTAGASAWTLVGVVGGYMLFKRLERGISDRV